MYQLPTSVSAAVRAENSSVKQVPPGNTPASPRDQPAEQATRRTEHGTSVADSSDAHPTLLYLFRDQAPSSLDAAESCRGAAIPMALQIITGPSCFTWVGSYHP